MPVTFGGGSGEFGVIRGEDRRALGRVKYDPRSAFGRLLGPPPLPPVVQDPALVQLGINVIRGLAMDAPEQANSGHSGTAMALAPLAHVLWTRIMRHDPQASHWPDRDRFVLSNGHACILLYSLLYLTGYDLSLDDIRQFRNSGAGRRGIPSGSYGRRRSHHRTTRPGRRPTPSVWPSPSGSYGPVSGATSATTARTSSPETAASWRASRTRRRRSPGTSSWAG